MLSDDELEDVLLGWELSEIREQSADYVRPIILAKLSKGSLNTFLVPNVRHNN
jgi:hypothetical protein